MYIYICTVKTQWKLMEILLIQLCTICDISVRGPFLYVAPDLLGWARSQLGKVLVEKRLWIREMWVSYSGSSRSRKYFHSWRGFSWPWNQTLYLTQLFPFILVPLYQSVMWIERRELFLIFGLKSDSVTFLYLDWNQTQLSFFFWEYISLFGLTDVQVSPIKYRYLDSPRDRFHFFISLYLEILSLCF